MQDWQKKILEMTEGQELAPVFKKQDMKTRLEVLQAIEENINHYQRRIGELEKNPPKYYFLFAAPDELQHDLEICKRCLKHWMHRWTKNVNNLPKYD